MAKKVVAKKTSKSVSEKILTVDRRIFMHLLIIQSLLLLTQRVMRYHGLAQADLDSRAQRSRLLMLHRWQLKQQLRQHCLMD